MNGGNNGAIQSNARNVFYSIENYLTYSKEIDDNNSITALLGASWQQTEPYLVSRGWVWHSLGWIWS